MRVELSVDLRPTRRTPVAKQKPTAEARAEKQRLAREDRRLRQIALARLIEDRIASGEFASLADVARRCGVSRAQISAITLLRYTLGEPQQASCQGSPNQDQPSSSSVVSLSANFAK